MERRVVHAIASPMTCACIAGAGRPGRGGGAGDL